MARQARPARLVLVLSPRDELRAAAAAASDTTAAPSARRSAALRAAELSAAEARAAGEPVAAGVYRRHAAMFRELAADLVGAA